MILEPKSALIFLNTILVEKGGQKEASVEKYGKPIENVSISPVPLDSPILQHKISAAHIFIKIPFHVSIVCPSVGHEVMEPDTMILIF